MGQMALSLGALFSYPAAVILMTDRLVSKIVVQLDDPGRRPLLTAGKRHGPHTGNTVEPTTTLATTHHS